MERRETERDQNNRDRVRRVGGRRIVPIVSRPNDSGSIDSGSNVDISLRKKEKHLYAERIEPGTIRLGGPRHNHLATIRDTITECEMFA